MSKVTENKEIKVVPGEPYPKPNPPTTGYQGCPCMCFNADSPIKHDAESKAQIKFPKPTKKSGSSNYSTFSTLHWDGQSFKAPSAGIYFMMVSAMRGHAGSQDNAYIELRSDQNGKISEAQIGETEVDFKRPEYGHLHHDLNTGLLHVVTHLAKHEKIWLQTRSDSNHKVDLEDVKWSLFHICCNPSLGIPC